MNNAKAYTLALFIIETENGDFLMYFEKNAKK